MTRQKFYEQAKATIADVMSDYSNWRKSGDKYDVPKNGTLNDFLKEKYVRKYEPGDLLARSVKLSSGQWSFCVEVILRIDYRIGEPDKDCYVTRKVNSSNTGGAPWLNDSTDTFEDVAVLDSSKSALRLGSAIPDHIR